MYCILPGILHVLHYPTKMAVLYKPHYSNAFPDEGMDCFVPDSFLCFTTHLIVCPGLSGDQLWDPTHWS